MPLQKLPLKYTIKSENELTTWVVTACLPQRRISYPLRLSESGSICQSFRKLHQASEFCNRMTRIPRLLFKVKAQNFTKNWILKSVFYMLVQENCTIYITCLVYIHNNILSSILKSPIFNFSHMFHENVRITGQKTCPFQYLYYCKHPSILKCLVPGVIECWFLWKQNLNK